MTNPHARKPVYITGVERALVVRALKYVKRAAEVKAGHVCSDETDALSHGWMASELDRLISLFTEAKK